MDEPAIMSRGLKRALVIDARLHVMSWTGGITFMIVEAGHNSGYGLRLHSTIGPSRWPKIEFKTFRLGPGWRYASRTTPAKLYSPHN